MGKVDCFQWAGLELWFNSRDHLPPHFHAERADKWEVRVRFRRSRDEMIEAVYGPGPQGKERARLLDHAERFRDALLREWEAKVLVNAPGEQE